MAESSSLDPLALWRDLVSQWERGFNELANKAMASDEFGKSMHGSMGLPLAAQKSLADLIGRTLTTLNLPTRDDVAALGERLQAVESRLSAIAQALEQAAGIAVQPSGAGLPDNAPRRTRQPPPRALAAAPTKTASTDAAATEAAQAQAAPNDVAPTEAALIEAAPIAKPEPNARIKAGKGAGAGTGKGVGTRAAKAAKPAEAARAAPAKPARKRASP